MGQITLTQLQAISLMEALGETDEQGAVITQRGRDIYIAMAATSATISPDGDITEEDFG
jgi:hypothetical protein